MNEIERIEEVMQIIKTNHMCQDIDGDCTEQDRIDYRARFAALKAGAEALRETLGNFIKAKEADAHNEMTPKFTEEEIKAMETVPVEIPVEEPAAAAAPSRSTSFKKLIKRSTSSPKIVAHSEHGESTVIQEEKNLE